FCLETQRLEPGDRALFYLFPRPNGTWNAFRRTRPLDQSADDLLFIRALPHSLEQTRLSGTVRNIHDKSRTMPGIPVTATGEGVEVTTHTNGDGVYEFYGLPEGRYDVRIEPAPFYRAEAHASRPKGRGDGIRGYILDLEAGLSVDFRLLEDYQISGRVLVPETSPLPPRVSLKSTGGARIGVSQVSHDGAFSFTGMPAGTYLITFPGSNTGLPVSIGRGQKLEGVLIPFPPPPVARPADQMRQ
ncbi:MAG: carboxypeptidase-like regulatory domain-containing protein, partial [Bryobacteraceae bacterium]